MSDFKDDKSKSDSLSHKNPPKKNQQPEITSLPESSSTIPGKPERRLFSYVPVRKGASIGEVEHAVNSALEDPDRPTTTLASGREQSHGAPPATGKTNMKVEASGEQGGKGARQDKDTPFFKDNKDALLMVVKQEGGP